MDKILENIRSIRESKGYSQESFAEMLKLTQPAYARFERGAIKTDLKTVRAVADAFGMTLIDLITYPKKYVELDTIGSNNKTEVKATLTIEMGKEKKDQVFRFIFGDHDVEIANK
ncbi:helix-turn-helix transcriptional regulator [Bacteroides sp. ET489]|jgi:transcriptional regulator with XRE-family HTH domain|uniref:helix-turn-helix domain-containing protein n=1 Tax=Bacteroides sp. ET489 TaxID=3057126 RepID=UPI002671043F|nr:helix-turn-helix transcriptional regulator [Bacteroides sp. ET489]MDO3390035.1 helix-turn-helix transcriptional regulator [Bacteroides sp. ET489]